MSRKDLKMFAQDTEKYGTYFYASAATLSIDLSSKRRCRSILEMESFAGKRVIDIGCGDGIYTYELMRTNPALVLGVDPIAEVIEHARKKYADFPNLHFECADLYTMEVLKEKYDVVVLRGVLHHLPDLDCGIQKACLLLKIIEKTSRYHVEHQEKSFFPSLLRKEFSKNGAKIIKDEYIGLVPTFCLDWMVPILKFFEPLVERLPIIKNIACGQYVFLAEITDKNYDI